MAHTRAGAAALGAAAAAGVSHMAHRFIVGETPRAGAPDARAACGAAAWPLGGPARRGHGDPRRGRPLRGALRGRDRRAGRRRCAGWPERPVLEGDAHGPLPRANLSVKVSALTPLMRPEAPRAGEEDAAAACVRCSSGRPSAARTCTSTWSRSTPSSSRSELVFDLLAEHDFRDGPSAGVVLQAYLRDSPERLERILEWAAAPAPAAARRPSGEGRLLGPRGRRGAPARLERARVRGQGGVRPQLRGPDARGCSRRAPARARRGRLPQRALGLARDRGQPRGRRRGHGPRAPGAARPGRRPRHALAALGFRVRAYCPVGDLVAGMAYLVRRLLENTANESFLAEQAGGAELDELLAAP